MEKYKEFEFNVKLYGQMSVKVFAENQKKAEQTLNRALYYINVQDVENKISKCKEVKIKDSAVTKQITKKDPGIER